MQKFALLVGILAISSAASARPAEPADQPAGPWWRELISDFELRPTISFSTGYDSNPEEERAGQGSWLKRVDVGLRTSIGDPDETRIIVSAEASFIDYVETALPTDYEYDVGIEAGHRLSDAVALSFGATHDRDGTDDPPTSFNEVWGRVEADLAPIAWEFRGSVDEYREAVSRDDRDDDEFENFDYRRGSARMRAEVDTGWMVHPVIEARASLLDYLEQRPGKRNRDALDMFAMVGAEVEVGDGLRALLGLRRNERFFEEPGDNAFATIGPELELEWDPVEKLSFELSIGRRFDEPGREDGLIQDEWQGEVELTYEPSDRLTLNGVAAMKFAKEVGTDYDKFEWEASARARYAFREHLAFVLEAWATGEERRDDPEDDFTRSMIRVGGEASF